MLTPEYTTLRLRDNEIKKLRDENKRLSDKILNLKIGFVELIKGVAKGMDSIHKAKMIEMANELECDIEAERKQND